MEREEMTSELNVLEAKHKEMLAELEGFKNLDPDLFDQKSMLSTSHCSLMNPPTNCVFIT